MRHCTDASPDFIISQSQAMIEDDSDDAGMAFTFLHSKEVMREKTIIA